MSKFELKMDQKDVTIENSRLIGGERSTGGVDDWSKCGMINCI